MSIRILGTGSYLPEKVMTNKDFEKIIDTTDEWISTRTGMSERHYVQDGMTNTDMCVIAAKRAMEQAGINANDIGGIIVATVTGEMSVPSIACQVQRELDIDECFAFDVNAACSGFLFALKVASGLVKKDGKPFIVIGTETLSRFMNMEDRGSCILFADGTGAAVVEYGDNLKYFEIYSKPDHDGFIEINGMNTIENGVQQPSYVSLKGKEVYVFSTREAQRVLTLALDELNMNTDQVDWYLFHQANLRIIQTAAARLKIPMEKVFVNIDKVANTAAASIPIALDDMNRQGLLKKGDIIALTGFGGGLTSGCAIYEW